VLSTRVRDGEPPSVASHDRHGSWRGRVDADVVDADIVYADKGTIESISLNLSRKESTALKTE
jgi:hypothetical protein